MPGSDRAGQQRLVGGPDSVLPVSRLEALELESIASRFGIDVVYAAKGEAIEGSYWGDSEAGLVANRLIVRDDTPVHSALHELGHYVCMPPSTRAKLDTNAGGDYDEENGVCFLQILLSSYLPSFNRERMFEDMDAWGYTFRLGSARAWFERDAQDAKAWLLNYGIIDLHSEPTWRIREQEQ